MTPRQKLELRMSEVRQRLNEISGLEGDAFTDEVRAEADTLTAEYRDLETRHRAAIVANPGEDGITTADGETPEDRERVELRQRCRATNWLLAAVAGRTLSGAEAELAAETGLEGIPLEIFETGSAEQRAEHRVDTATGTPSTTGVNLDPIRPMIYARAVIPRLGVAMPRVGSGTYATATITTGLSAGATAAGAARESTAAQFTARTTTPHRVSARLSIRVEDVATVGVDNFESALRQNLMLAMSDELDKLGLTGNGTAPNPAGLLQQLTDPTAATTEIDWNGFVRLMADGIDGGPWAEQVGDVRLLVNRETMRLAERTFKDGQGYGGEMSAAAYLRGQSGGFFSSRRMPDTTNTVAAAIRYRAGTLGLDGVDAMRTAVCPVWNEIAIDDIYSDSASGTRHFTMHSLIGDVLIEQTDAYEQISIKVGA